MDGADWDRVESALLAEGGTLPDGAVTGTVLSDWQAVLGLIGRQPWSCEFTMDGEPRPVPASAARLFDVPGGGLLAVQIAPGIQINVFPNAATEILFDFSTEEIQGGRLAEVGTFVRELGLAVGKPVALSHEGDDSLVFLTYDPESDTFEPAL